MKKYLLFGCIFSLVTLSATAQDGKQLHDDFCVSCHTAAIYTREERIVNSYPELQERVRQCELANNLTWFDDEIEAVINYLNVNYYQFEIK